MSSASTLQECQTTLNDPYSLSKQKVKHVLDSLSMIIQSDIQEIDKQHIGVVLDTLETVVLNLYIEVDELKEEVRKLKEEVRKLNKVVENSDFILLKGQLARKVEQEMVKRIFKDTGVKEITYVTINQLETVYDNRRSKVAKRIFGKSSTVAVEKACENWDQLEEELPLGDLTVYSAIQSFKSERNCEAHPSMSLMEAYQFLRTSPHLDNDDEKMVKVMYEVLHHFKIENINTH